MRVISGGPIGQTPVIHFEAPSAKRVEDEMDRFLEWFNQPEDDPDLTRKAAVVHLWFVTVHPYDDYQALQVTRSGSMDIAAWMAWFLDCLTSAVDHGDRAANMARSRARLQAFAQANGLNARQVKFLDRALYGWSGNVIAAGYGRMTRCSRQTATDDIDQLIKLGILASNQAGGRSTSCRAAALGRRMIAECQFRRPDNPQIRQSMNLPNRGFPTPGPTEKDAASVKRRRPARWPPAASRSCRQ